MWQSPQQRLLACLYFTRHSSFCTVSPLSFWISSSPPVTYPTAIFSSTSKSGSDLKTTLLQVRKKEQKAKKNYSMIIFHFVDLPKSLTWYSIATAATCWLCYTPFWLNKFVLASAIFFELSSVIQFLMSSGKLLVVTMLLTYIYSAANPSLYWVMKALKTRRAERVSSIF